MRSLYVGMFCALSIFQIRPMCVEPMWVECHETPGRFGDQLMHRMHALWLEYTRGVMYVHTPFEYSDSLNFFGTRVPTGKHVVVLASDADRLLMPEPNTLYDFHHFPDGHDELAVAQEKHQFWFDVNWDDQGFLKLLRERIIPREGVLLNLVQPKPGRINIALHVRRGGGYDVTATSQGINVSAGRVDFVYPSKFPHNEFFVAQLLNLRRYFGSQPLSVFIFTDHQVPEFIRDVVKNGYQSAYQETYKVVDQLIEFSCRPSGGHAANVIDDFFSLMRFEVIIRPESAFTQVAAKLGRPMLEIWPESCTYDGVSWTCARVGVATRSSLPYEFITRITSWDELLGTYA